MSDPRFDRWWLTPDAVGEDTREVAEKSWSLGQRQGYDLAIDRMLAATGYDEPHQSLAARLRARSPVRLFSVAMSDQEASRGPFSGETGSALYSDGPGADGCCEGCEHMQWECGPYPAGEHGTETVWLWVAVDGEHINYRDNPPGCVDPATLGSGS